MKEGIILDLKEHDGKLWIATDGEGIFIMDPETFKTGRLQDSFWFEIPEGLPCQSGISIRCNEENYQTPPADNATIMENGFDLSNCTVLVAEDETDLLEFIDQELRPIFKEVYTARNGNEALEMAGSLIPDIIISDVMMPMKNGYELCREIKNDISISHTPVILLTVLEDGVKRQTGYKEVTGLGIMEYVTRKRMTKAAELLAKTQLPISEIARESGYSDNQYFSKVFRQYFNMSPSSYRNQSSHPDEQ